MIFEALFWCSLLPAILLTVLIFFPWKKTPEDKILERAVNDDRRN